MGTTKAKTAPQPDAFETHVMPNMSNERGRLAREAGELSRDELAERAAAVGIDPSGSRAAITERVQDAARND